MASSGSRGGELLGQLEHHLALLHRGVVLHLPVEHHGAGAVAHGGDHLAGVAHVVGVGGEDALGDVDLHRVEAPRAHAAEQVGVAELVLAGDRVLDVAEGAVEGEDPVGLAGVDHAGDGVVPEVLLVGGARAVDVAVDGVLAHEVAGVAAADAGGLHAAVGGQVGGTEAEALHARRLAPQISSTLATPRAVSRMACTSSGSVRPGLGLELGEEPVDVVDVLGALDLRDHDHVELLAAPR